MKFYSVLLIIFMLVSGLGGRTFGQAADSVYQQQPLQYALTLYQNAMEDESHLYNGPQYVNYDKHYMVGHQFFRTDEPAPAGIFYDGAWYAQVPMLYDILQDKIVLEHPHSEFLFSLVNEKVKYFTFQEHTFIRLEKDSLAGSPLKTGFYDLLHDGTIKLLAKRAKAMQEQATQEGMKGHFEQTNKYYIRKGNIYYPVKDKRSVLKVLPDKKKELQRYAREQKLKFGKNREKAILQLTRFYDKPNA